MFDESPSIAPAHDLSACLKELYNKGYSPVDPSSFNGYSETISLLYSATHKAGDNLEARRRVFESIQRSVPTLSTLIGEIIGDNSPAPRRFNPFTVNKILDHPRKVWLVQDVIGVGDTVMIFGESGARKSLVAQDFTFSSIIGRDFADHFHIARPLKIAYATGEGQSGLSTRFRELIAKYNANIDEISPRLEVYGITESPPQLFDGKSDHVYEIFVRELKQSGFVPDILILDTYHNVTVGANENDARDTGVILAAVNYIKQHLGCAVLIIHHTNKMGLVERGSGALRASCDTIISVRKEKNGEGIMECSKQKDGKEWNKSEARRFTVKSFSENGDGVAVQWLGEMGIDPDDTISSRESLNDNEGKVLGLIPRLPASPDGYVLSVLISSNSGGELTASDVSKALKGLAEKGKVEYRLQDPSQPENNRHNKRLYRLTSNQNEVEDKIIESF